MLKFNSHFSYMYRTDWNVMPMGSYDIYNENYACVKNHVESSKFIGLNEKLFWVLFHLHWKITH